MRRLSYQDWFVRPAGALIVLCFAIAGSVAMGVPLQEARVSRVIQDVRLLTSNVAPRPAVVNDNVHEGTAVRTGVESRAELTFSDQTITRLGQNTVFSLKGGTREVTLDSGALLLEVPQHGEAAQIRTAAVTASISGGTGLLSSNKGFPTKLLILEGTGRFCSIDRPDDCVDVHGGEMVMMMPDGRISKPTKFNAKLVFQSSHLLTDFPPLPNEFLILEVINEQQTGPEQTGTPPPGDTIDDTDQRAAATPTPSETPGPTSTPTPSVTPTPTPSATPTPTPSATPTPTPSATPTPTPSTTPTPTPSATPTPTATPSATPDKYGTPSVISSPDPYAIDSNTVISTDPAITTNGNTDYGKIYRGPGIDGVFSAWAFGSTSGFDTSSGFDAQIDSSGAGFKFSSLVLAGDPTIDITNGEFNLGFIAVNSITSGTPGGTLTFAGIRGLLLATVNGPITLGPEISFSVSHDLTIYARGTTSDLTLGSDLDTSAEVHLYAERDILATSTISTEKFTAIAGRDISFGQSFSGIDAVTISMSAGRGILLNGLSSDQTAVDSSGDVSLIADGNLTSTTGIYVRRFNGGQMTGSNILLDVGSDIAVGTSLESPEEIANDISLIVDNSEGERVAGDLTSGANIAVNAGRSLTINGGSLSLTVDNQGGSIQDGGNISLSVGATFNARPAAPGKPDVVSPGDVNITGDATFEILNDGGGQIGNNVGLQALTGGNFTANSLFALIGDRDGGSIGGDAALNLAIGGALSTTGDASFGTSTSNFGGGGGTIDANAIVSLDAASISVGGFLESFVATNGGGGIGGSATDSISATGTLMAENGILATIEDTAFGGTGGQIGEDATVTLSAQNIITPSDASGTPGTDTMAIEASIYPNASGVVGGNAIVNVSASEDISAVGTVLFWVANGNYQELGGGTIGGDAEVNVTATDLSSGDLLLQILNYGGASIGGHALVSLNVTNLDVGGDLDAWIDNSDGGSIGTAATMDFNVSGNATVAGDATVTIDGSDGAESAAINFNGGNYEVGGEFFSTIDSDGTIAFTNANVHADVLKVGVFGTNGTLNVGGGSLSGDTELKLYAPGSNGSINFTANVTLNSTSTAAIIAANTVTISNNVTVTIGGSIPAAVYTNVPNYTGSGGNGTTTGTFDGAGATTSPLADAPPFDSGEVAAASNGSGGGAPRAEGRVINVASSEELRALVDGLPKSDEMTPNPTAGNLNRHNPNRAHANRELINPRREAGSGSTAGGPGGVGANHLVNRLPP